MSTTTHPFGFALPSAGQGFPVCAAVVPTITKPSIQTQRTILHWTTPKPHLSLPLPLHSHAAATLCYSRGKQFGAQRILKLQNISAHQTLDMETLGKRASHRRRRGFSV